MIDGDSLRAVLSHYNVQFRDRRRGNQQIRCVFHDDTHASMSINLDNGLWRCFTCATAGDAITFIEQKENVEYGDARRILDGLDDGGGGRLRDKPVGQSSGLLPGVARNQRRGRREFPTWLRAGTGHRA